MSIHVVSMVANDDKYKNVFVVMAFIPVKHTGTFILEMKNIITIIVIKLIPG